MMKKIFTYGFPLFLIAIEKVFRIAMNTESENFMGPTLAAVGLGFLSPLLIPKNKHIPASKNFVMIDVRDEFVMDTVKVMILVEIIIWTYSLLLSSRNDLQTVGVNEYQMKFHLFLGWLNYALGIFCAVWKEKV